MVGEALKGGRLAAAVLAADGYRVVPPPGPSTPWSFITAVELGSRERMAAFCTAVQQCCPVGSYIRPIPGVGGGRGARRAGEVQQEVQWHAVCVVKAAALRSGERAGRAWIRA